MAKPLSMLEPVYVGEKSDMLVTDLVAGEKIRTQFLLSFSVVISLAGSIGLLQIK